MGSLACGIRTVLEHHHHLATPPSGGRPPPHPRQGLGHACSRRTPPPTMPRIPPFSLPGSVEPFSLVPHLLSATDTFPDDTPTQLWPQPMGDSYFSDIEDGGSSDDSASHFSAPTTLADDAAVIPPTVPLPLSDVHLPSS